MLLLAFAVIAIAGCSSTEPTPSSNVNTIDINSEDTMKIPLSEISSSIRKYSFDDNGVEVKYFIVQDADGTIRTAFDACDVCGGYKG